MRVGPDGQNWVSIVGVVEDVRLNGAGLRPIPVIYRPYVQNPLSILMTFALQSDLPEGELMPALRQAIRRQDRDAPLAAARPMTEVVARSVEKERMIAVLLGGFGAFALLLAAPGTYSIISHRVQQRQHEFGVRPALGSTRLNLLRLVLGQGLRVAGWGISGGVTALFLLRPLWERLLPTSSGGWTEALLAVLT